MKKKRSNTQRTQAPASRMEADQVSTHQSDLPNYERDLECQIALWTDFVRSLRNQFSGKCQGIKGVLAASDASDSTDKFAVIVDVAEGPGEPLPLGLKNLDDADVLAAGVVAGLILGGLGMRLHPDINFIRSFAWIPLKQLFLTADQVAQDDRFQARIPSAVAE